MLAARQVWEGRRSFGNEPLHEDGVAAAWEAGLFGGELRAGSGEKLQIVYRGRRSADAGPDFRDAIIATADGRLRRGDVEIHVRASDWRSHGHGRDRRYNGVVLHVVMWDDIGEPTTLASGATAPVLALYPFLTASLDALRETARQKHRWEEPCNGILTRLSPELARTQLDSAGQMRLARKAAGLEAAIACVGTEQALYEGVLEALGYAKNREPFRQLAESLPLASLQGLAQGRKLDEAVRRVEAVLLGVAGLLPSQRQRPLDGDYAGASLPGLEQEWQRYGGDRWLTEDHWTFFRTRLDNFPTRRIAGAAQLIVRSRDQGLVEHLLQPLSQPTPAAVRRALVASLLVSHDHDTNRADRLPQSRLIGRGRATVIAVNVVLPFAIAHASQTAQPQLADHARWAYFSFPRLPSDAVVRRMSQQLAGIPSSPLVNSACRQQGLHHLHGEFCQRQRCSDCPLAT